jgi:hypothetical protein
MHLIKRTTEDSMNTFDQLIEGIALAKVINAGFAKQPIYTSFHALRKEQKEKLISALIDNNKAVQEVIVTEITSALENKIDEILKPTEEQSNAN